MSSGITRLWRFSFIQVKGILKGVESGTTGLDCGFSTTFHLSSKRFLQFTLNDLFLYLAIRSGFTTVPYSLPNRNSC